jgi:hypothetical protein
MRSEKCDDGSLGSGFRFTITLSRTERMAPSSDADTIQPSTRTANMKLSPLSLVALLVATADAAFSSEHLTSDDPMVRLYEDECTNKYRQTYSYGQFDEGCVRLKEFTEGLMS